jgi:uncharacterized protein (TIGR03435 family)
MGVVFAIFAAFGQPADPPLVFEVASVKPDVRSKAGGLAGWREIITPDPGRLIMLNVRMSTCIRWAYDVKDYQVSGPNWIENERYDIAAKAAGAVPESDLRRMLQTLLAERFKLEFHRVKKDLAVYVLQVAKNGPKFHESEGEGELAVEPTGKAAVSIRRAEVAQLVEMLEQVLRMPILDETGLKGHYDIAVDMSSYIPENLQRGVGPPPDIAGIVMSALPEQLGLKLEARKAPLDMLIVDRLERAPTEN